MTLLARIQGISISFVSFVFAFVLVISLSVFASLPSTPPSESDGGMYGVELKSMLTGGTTLASYYAIPGSLMVADADKIDGLDSTALQRKIGADCASGTFMTSVQSDGTIVCNGAMTLSGTCGTANGTSVGSYPAGASACSLGTQTDIDTVANDGSYNWNCDSVSCSATKVILNSCATDITLSNGQVWQACNLGATGAGMSAASYGNYYYFGIGNEINSPGGLDTVSGRWYPFYVGTCASGYHIPTRQEWQDAADSEGLSLVAKLKLPYTGVWNSARNFVGLDGYYWSSTYHDFNDGQKKNYDPITGVFPFINNATAFRVSATDLFMDDGMVVGRSSATPASASMGYIASVRCIKDSVVGSCGTASGTTLGSYPTGSSACSSGAQADVDTSGADGSYNWNCGTVSCSAVKSVAPQAGACNNSAPLGCSVGSPINDNNQVACNTTRTWNCSGVNSGATSPQCSFNNASCSAGNCMVTNETWGAGCSANAPSGQSIVNGGTTGPFTIANTAPGYTGSASFLCWDSEPTAVITPEWTATNISCSPVAPVPQAGSCNNSMALGCSVGSPINDNNQTACNTTRTWNCDGVNSGAVSPQCSFNNGACGCVSAPSASQSIACSTAASLGYTAPGNTAGTAYYKTETAACKPNVGQVIWTDVSGCTPPACVSAPSSSQSIACSSVAGSYGIPATYTQGTAFYKTETAACKVNFGQVIWTDITGCSPPAAVVNGQCGNDYQCIVGNPQNFSNPIGSLPSRSTVTWKCVGSGPGHTDGNCSEMTGQVKDPYGPSYSCATPGKVVRTLGSGCFYSEDLIYPNAGSCYEAFCD